MEITCPMCGKKYTQEVLEQQAKKDNVTTKYCCPYCGWAWDPAGEDEVKKAVRRP